MSDGPLLIDTHVLWWWENGTKGQISAATMNKIEGGGAGFQAVHFSDVGLGDRHARRQGTPHRAAGRFNVDEG